MKLLAGRTNVVLPSYTSYGSRAVTTYARHNHNKVLLESNKAKTAIGVSDFTKLVRASTVFVDKSLFVKEFYEDPGETLLMTFPRRWGKTINLDMVKTFFGIQVDEDGNQLPLADYDSYSIFRGGEIDLGFGETRKLSPLKIASDAALMKRQGRTC